MNKHLFIKACPVLLDQGFKLNYSGNPILVGQWNDAQRALEDIQNNVNNLQIVNNRSS